MPIFLGADHAGFARKERVKSWLLAHGYSVEDVGAHTLEPTDDYPPIAEAVAKAVVAEPNGRGIVLCGNAEGVCMVANKVDGVRAALGYAPEAVLGARQDDNANILCLPGKLLDDASVQAMLLLFLSTPFSEAERHQRRLRQIQALEQQH